MSLKIKVFSLYLVLALLLPIVSLFGTSAVERTVENIQEVEGATGDLSLLHNSDKKDVTVIDNLKQYNKIIGKEDSSVSSKTRTVEANVLPESVDNSDNEYFPEIDTQGAMGSCVSWAQVYYQFTYTMNKSMGVATTSENTFSPKWTHNFANNGKKDGSWDDDVYNLMKEIGNVPLSMLPYDDEYLSWTPEENVWKTAMKYRVKNFQYVKDVGSGSTQITSPDDSDLDVIKNCLANGEILTFSTYLGACVKTTIKTNSQVPENDKYAGESVIVRRSGSSDGHRMTLVGYNDNIWTDINGNGVVDSGEMGAFKIANSWGKNYGNKGFIWVAYDAVNSTSCVSNAPSDSKRFFFWMNIARIDVVPYDSDSSIYLKYTLNTSDRIQSKIYATATKGDEEKTYEIGPKGKFGLTNSTFSYDGTTNSNDGTMVYALSNVVSGLTSENLHEYSWSFKFEDKTSDDSVFTVKNVEIIDEDTGRIISPTGVFPFSINGSSKTVDFPKIEESGKTIYYRGYKNPTLHYKVDDGEWNSLVMESNTSVEGYTHKNTLPNIQSDSVVTLWFSDDNGNIDDNKGIYYKTEGYVNYYETKNAREPLNVNLSGFLADENVLEADKVYNFVANISGGYDPYKIKYTYENINTGEQVVTDYSDSLSDKKSFASTGEYKCTVTVKDFTDETVSDTKYFSVENHNFEIESFSVQPAKKIKVGKKISLTAITNYEHIKESGKYNEYKITIQKDGTICYSVTVISSIADTENMTSTVYLSWVPETSGDYVATVSSTDDKGEYAEKSISFKVTDYLLGDINGDGNITVSDATILQRYIAKVIDNSNVFEMLSDVDKNGTINIKDATYIQKYLIGLTDCANVGEILDVEPDVVDPPNTVPTTVTTTTVPVNKNYIYYKNTNNWSTVKAYYWSETNTTMTSWPGVAMTNIGNNVYRIEVPSAAQYIIFNDGNSQTDNIKLQGMNMIYNNGTWSAYQ